MDYESKVTQITVQGEGRSFPIVIFDNPLCLEITRTIIEGKTYPLIGFIKNVKTVLDIGANIGAASVFFALHYPDARIYSFEPCPHTYHLLTQNVAIFPHVQSFNFGLFDRNCETPLHLGHSDGVTNSVGQSCLNGGRTVSIRLANIREFLRERSIGEIDVLKVDTEGCELPILEAIVDLIDRIRVIYVEYHDEADRLAIDAMLRGTHLLIAGAVRCAHRGEFCYVAYSSFPSRAESEIMRIRSDALRGLGSS